MNNEVKFPFRIKGGQATWQLTGVLDVSVAQELKERASEIVNDKRVKRVTVELPNQDGVPTAGFQVLTAFQAELARTGRHCSGLDSLAPAGGRTW